MAIDSKYKIDIDQDPTYRQGSADNLNKYDFEYFHKSEYVFSIIGIRIYSDGLLIKSAVIGCDGGGSVNSDKSKIIENDKIVICCANSVFCLSIPELTLLWRTQSDDSMCIEIFKYQDSYIVHGELNITRLDKNGKIIWQKGGADIFTTMTGTNDFELDEKFIKATDWENRIYKFGYDGRDYTDMTQFNKWKIM